LRQLLAHRGRILFGHVRGQLALQRFLVIPDGFIVLFLILADQGDEPVWPAVARVQLANLPQMEDGPIARSLVIVDARQAAMRIYIVRVLLNQIVKDNFRFNAICACIGNSCR